MPFNFRMILSGLLVVVPDRRFEKTVEAAGTVTILVPNLLSSRVLSTGQALEPHVPVLEFDLAHRRDPSTRETDLVNPDRGKGICSLRTEEIEVLPVPSLASSFEIVGGRPANKQTPTLEERRSLFWMTTMEQAVPGSELQPELLDGPRESSGRIPSSPESRSPAAGSLPPPSAARPAASSRPARTRSNSGWPRAWCSRSIVYPLTWRCRSRRRDRRRSG